MLSKISAKSLLDQWNQVYILTDKNRLIVDCSGCTSTLVKSMLEDREIPELTIDILAEIKGLDNIKTEIDQALAGQKTEVHKKLGESGSSYHFQYLPINENDENNCLILINELIDQNHLSHLELKRLDSIVDSQSGGVITRHVHNPDGTVEYLYVSKGIKELSGVTSEEVMENPEVLFSGIYDETELTQLMGALQKSIETMTTFSHEWKIILPSGQVKWLKGTGQPSKMGDSIVFDSIVLDVTDLKESHEREKNILNELEYSKTLLSNIADTLPGAMTRLRRKNGKTQFDYISPGIKELSGHTATQILETPEILFNHVLQTEKQPLRDALDKSLERLAPFNHIWRIKSTDGKIKWINGLGIPKVLDDGSKIMDSINLDITDLKQAEESVSRSNQRLVISIQENKLLLKELQHRVKNNLHLISSIIFLKSRGTTNLELKEFTQEINSRILTMAQSHERILGTGKFVSQSTKLYFDKLVLSMLEAYAYGRTLYDFHLDIEDFTLSHDQMTSLGLIANEIISNTFKHAYAPEIGGKIDIKLERIDEKCQVIIRDYGKGYDPSKTRKNSVGMSLIHRLVDQLEGTHSITVDSGVIHRLEFDI